MSTSRARFLEALDPGTEQGTEQARHARVGLVGVPYDGAVTYRAGAREAPPAIRAASESIESYCPRMDRDLLEAPPVDCGDLDVSPSQPGGRALVDHVRAQLEGLGDLRMLAVGGDHLIAYPFLQRALQRHPDLQILHIDAHADLREAWEGEPLNHATVMRRVLEHMGPDARLHPWGIRSGLREEFTLMREDARIEPIGPPLQSALQRAHALAAAGRPIYVTLDVDGVDPGQLPGTGTPEPGGLAYVDVESVLVQLGRAGAPVIGADLVELAPGLDPSGISAVAGARLARTLLLVLQASVQTAA